MSLIRLEDVKLGTRIDARLLPIGVITMAIYDQIGRALPHSLDNAVLAGTNRSGVSNRITLAAASLTVRDGR